MLLGSNTFGLKYDLKKDFAGTILRLKAAGFTAVEICVTGDRQIEEMLACVPEEKRTAYLDSPFRFAFFPMSEAGERIREIRELGLAVVDMHLSLPGEPDAENMAELTQVTIAFLKENGLFGCVVSGMKNLEGTKALAPYLEQMAAELKQAGFVLMYHNHDIECVPEAGTTAFDYLMEHYPSLSAEPDVGWMVMGGSDPVAFIRRYKDRIPCLHLKDFAKENNGADAGEARFAAIGEGILPLAEVMEAAKELKLIDNGLVIDQDASTGDFIEDLKRGKENVERVVREQAAS